MIRTVKPVKGLMIAMILALLLLWIGPMSIVSAGVPVTVTIKVNGETVKLNGSAIIAEGRTYVPVARIAKKFGAKLNWDNANEELYIHTALNDTVVLGNGVPVIYFNDERYRMEAPPRLIDGKLYAPLRTLASILHARLSATDKVIELKTVQPATVTEEYGLDGIIAQYGSSKTGLLKRNGLLKTAEVTPGTKLSVVVPDFLGKPAKPFTEADLKLLAKITMVEAGYESYQGQLALANVILNRVKSGKFPDSIRGVIYSGRQFPPAHNGLLDKSKPHASALRAAKDALNGKNNIGNAVYFYNPAVTKGAFWSSLDVVATIGHHRFAC
ncbi:cell wall hydrolase [Paenibacillus montanisoli]|uniref:Cell wall hydrolase n=1 Tax=Paenibacillus montanisoli TaxID=2081970 RepID=A0A328U578_9BACL|nr:cell wall hydrolase [Paenibacillus montanisoli]RAP77760.1 cell wall hydrolase [Paenibacillus montanisoli]